MVSMSAANVGRRATWICVLLVAGACTARSAHATDYFLTIGGGYNRTGNQASLEANVLFFQQLLTEKHPGPRRHDIFFADGNDPAADLQVLDEKPAESDSPATDLLATLHRRRGSAGNRITYRDHRVPDVAGPLDPKLIRESLERLATEAKAGDRLVVFVTAHGSPGPDKDEYNTTIDCWNEKKITARQFASWLDKLPAEVPVIMVMAQCYCGGFGDAIFKELDEDAGLAPQQRVGFFAQQHNLPAAGCRPDIEHDEEFSSYFWGAIAGRTRNGVPIEDADVNGDGVVSFAEAYAHAVIAGETIDIPLRTTEVLLRAYSRFPDDTDLAAAEAASTPAEGEQKPALTAMRGKLADLVAGDNSVNAHIVAQIAKNNGITMQADVAEVRRLYEEARRARRGPNRQRTSSGRRELLAEIGKEWPELADPRAWRDSELLKPENQKQLMADIEKLPAWKTYEERQKQLAEASKAAEKAELRSVKLRRLLNTLEVIVLAKNLPLVAQQDVVQRYEQMIQLENSSLQPAAAK